MSAEKIIFLVCCTVGVLLASRGLVHYFQLESYQFPGFYRTLKRNPLKALLPGLILAFAVFAAGLIPGFTGSSAVNALVKGILPFATGMLLYLADKKEQKKKKLNYTPRIKRLYCVYAAFVIASLWFVPAEYCFCWFIFLPVWFAAAGLLAWPVEKAISEMYFRDARRKLLGADDLIRIGITGSWGKTSVKFILGTLLNEKYQTLVTPSSFNTPMGVTKVIRSGLEPSHRVFVAEMGARHVGDIRELCRLVHPEIGLITSVGPQHLDTFKTIERVKSTKYELMEAVPDGGCCFFADDGENGIVRSLYGRTEKKKVLAGTDSVHDDVWAENISVSPEGSTFILCTKDRRIHCSTKLLGETNVRNITLAASVAIYLGLNDRQIANGIAKLEPVEHRLQLITRPGCMTVIDDAFNSNIKGAKQAFDVLACFENNRKIVITPGMVELGDKERELNREFGMKLAECTDIAVLVGEKHTQPIVDGMKDKGFPEERIYVRRTLDEAVKLLESIGNPDDIVLFENDLPDNYTE